MQPAPVLDYGHAPASAQSRLNVPLNPAPTAVIVALLSALLAGAFGGGNVPVVAAVVFGGVVGGMVYASMLARIAWALPIATLFQLGAAIAVFAVTCTVICARAGETGGMAGGPAHYWTSHNQGFRYGPRHAIRPWPVAALAFSWFTAALTVGGLRRRTPAAACPPPNESE